MENPYPHSDLLAGVGIWVNAGRLGCLLSLGWDRWRSLVQPLVACRFCLRGTRENPPKLVKSTVHGQMHVGTGEQHRQASP